MVLSNRRIRTTEEEEDETELEELSSSSNHRQGSRSSSATAAVVAAAAVEAEAAVDGDGDRDGELITNSGGRLGDEPARFHGGRRHSQSPSDGMILTPAGLTDRTTAAGTATAPPGPPSPGFRVSEVFLTH